MWKLDVATNPYGLTAILCVWGAILGALLIALSAPLRLPLAMLARGDSHGPVHSWPVPHQCCWCQAGLAGMLWPVRLCDLLACSCYVGMFVPAVVYESGMPALPAVRLAHDMAFGS